jgi:hypothetical protein
MKKITYSNIAKNKIHLKSIFRHRKMNQYSTENLEIIVKRTIGLTGLILQNFKAKGFQGLMDIVPSLISFAIETPTALRESEKEIKDLNTSEILKVTNVALTALQEHFDIIDLKANFGIDNLKELVKMVISLIFDFNDNKNFTKEHLLELLNIVNFVVINEEILLNEIEDLDLFEGLNIANIIIKEIAIQREI